jgi:hypothetical protein
LSFRPFTGEWFLTDSHLLARPKVRYFGAYPAGFLLRARDLLAVGRSDQVLHVCSGKVRDYKCGPGCPGSTSVTHYHGQGDTDLTWDLDRAVHPDIIADVRDGKAWRSVIETHTQIQAVLADPPYTKEYAANYGVGADVFPPAGGIVKNAIDILPIGGRVGILSMEWPRYPKNKARQIAVVAVYVGNGNIARCYAVYERTA